MIRKTLILIFFVIGLTITQKNYAQNASNVNVNSLSQSQVDDAKKKVKAAGLTDEEVEELARQRGASEQQIADMKRRMQESNDSTETVTDPFEDAAKTVVEEENEISDFQKQKPPLLMNVFGANLFNSKNLTFEPSVNIQTPSNYEINIGDQVLISIWGNSQSNYQLTVNLSGQILIPDVGPVYIAGLTFAKAEAKIKNRLISIYADMGGETPNTFAQINLGQLNSIKVNLVGEVSTPGTYTLPATATVFNALYLSGGPSPIGSFRNISIIRNNKTIKNVDIYGFLVNGDPSDNIILKDNDVIFIPPAVKQVNVNGFFKRNCIFEMKDAETLADLIHFSGGFTKDAFTKRVQIYRKTQKRQQIIDVNEALMASTVLMDGDEIRNTNVLDLFENRVTITGAVYRPGEYEWQEGMTLKDLMNKASGVKEDVFKNVGLITRQNPDLTLKTISFDVDKVLSGETSIKLIPEDIVSVKSHFDIGANPYVNISGEVLKSGELPWSEGLTVSDVLFMAGGFTEAADSTMIEVSRRLSYDEASRISDTLIHVFTVNQSRGLKFNNQPFYLEPYDRISVKQAPGFREQASVTIRGEVVYSGDYAVRYKTQRISDLVKLAKGITPQAFPEGARLTRQSEEMGSEDIAIDLQKILDNPRGDEDLFLKNGDTLFVPELVQTVKVTGTVQNPFSITFEDGKTAKFYIDCSGGFGNNALKRRTYVMYANGYTAPVKTFLGIKKYPEVKPGSIVVVPEKPEKESKTSMWLAIASTMASVTVAIASIF